MPTPPATFDLQSAARQEMIHDGFGPDFPAGTDEQIAQIRNRGRSANGVGLPDTRAVLWSSIDNDTSRDLDQIEVAERAGDSIRVRVAIADVDRAVEKGTPIDLHAQSQTTTVYTAVKTFPMLPEVLSTDLTSLSENGDREAIVIEFLVGPEGDLSDSRVYRANVRNRAQLTYHAVGGWLEGTSGPDPKVQASAELQNQLKLQDEAAGRLRAQRHRLGALNFDRLEVEPVTADGQVKDITARKKTRADDLIEDFMIAANEVMAQTLTDGGVSSIRRVVRSPERWDRIVELAKQHGGSLPASPDAGALNAFLESQKKADPVHYPDLSLAVLKLMGPGEYVLVKPGESSPGHFGLAANDYTHSTAPNRRFADLVTQRLIKAVLAKQPAPYPDDELDAIAQNCTAKENAARKVERAMMKRVAAVALRNRIGQHFSAIVTGVTPKGVFVRITGPPVEGRLMHGENGVDVGDRIPVHLLSTDPQRGFIDFARD